MIYFTDRDLGKRFPETLAAAGLAVERHHDHFAPDCPDPVLAKHFVATAPKIAAFLAVHKPPFIAKVYRPTPTEIGVNADAQGSVVLWYPK